LTFLTLNKSDQSTWRARRGIVSPDTRMSRRRRSYYQARKFCPSSENHPASDLLRNSIRLWPFPPDNQATTFLWRLKRL